MPIRTIRTGIGSYVNPAGAWTFGQLGDEVDVHEGDLERFDRLNPAAPPTAEADAPEGNEPDGSEAPEPYKGVTVPDLKAEIEKRNEGREDADKVVPAEPGNRPELVAALVADDAKQNT